MSEPKPCTESEVRDLNLSEAAAREKVKAVFPDFAARRRTLGMPRMTKGQSSRLDRMIRGEE